MEDNHKFFVFYVYGDFTARIMYTAELQMSLPRFRDSHNGRASIIDITLII